MGGRRSIINRASSLLRQAGSAEASCSTTTGQQALPIFHLRESEAAGRRYLSTLSRGLLGPSNSQGAATCDSLTISRGISVEALRPSDRFAPRHNSASQSDVDEMVKITQFDSLDALIDATVPSSIKLGREMDLGEYTNGFTESEFIAKFKKMAEKNKVFKSYIGMGYYNTILPPVIQRNLLENPGWYTQYTPYQAEIAQGRLESLLNFQTIVSDLTGMSLANSSLLDEATAAAEAMTMCSGIARGKKAKFLISDRCHPQTIAVCQSRAEGLGLEAVVISEDNFEVGSDVSGVLIQYPATDGSVYDYAALADKVHDGKAKLVVATDLLALTQLKPPGEWGADMVIGSAQRFGVPMGYGGPHAAFLATHEEYKRMLPGRIIGVSKDSHGNQALRMAMQTREQHIRRDKATSNICTAQALLANIAAMYGVYHGPDGLKEISTRVHGLAGLLAAGAKKLGLEVGEQPFFDTVKVGVKDAVFLAKKATDEGVNLRLLDDKTLTISIDETTTLADIDQLLQRRGAIVNVTADEKALTTAHGDIQGFLESLPESAAENADWHNRLSLLNEAITVPTQVNYVGKAVNLYEDAGYQLSGSSYVINKLLGTTWLWDRVRVSGGAYGGFSDFDSHNGMFTFLSYRDPNLLKTVDVYDGTADFLRELQLDQDALNKAIIGTIGDVDSYQLPDAKGHTAFMRHLLKISDSERQQRREQILATSLKDFRDFAEVVAAVKGDKGKVVAITSSERAQAVNEKERPGFFEAIHKVL